MKSFLNLFYGNSDLGNAVGVDCGALISKDPRGEIASSVLGELGLWMWVHGDFLWETGENRFWQSKSPRLDTLLV